MNTGAQIEMLSANAMEAIAEINGLLQLSFVQAATQEFFDFVTRRHSLVLEASRDDWHGQIVKRVHPVGDE